MSDTILRTVERTAATGDEGAQMALVAQMARRGDLAGLETLANAGARGYRATFTSLSQPTTVARAAAAELVSALSSMGADGREELARLCVAHGWWATDFGADSALAAARLAAGENVYAMQFSGAGPCLTRGRIVSASAKFYTVVNDSLHNGHGARRVARASLHTVPCARCSGGSDYPMGYRD